MVFGLLKKKMLKKSKKSKKKVVKRKTARKAKRPKKRGTGKRQKRTVIAPKGKKAVLELQLVGEITHYFPHVKAGVLKVSGSELNVGDTLHIKGHTTNFKQKIASMQIEHVSIKRAKKGDEIGLLVKRRVRIGDSVYRI